MTRLFGAALLTGGLLVSTGAWAQTYDAAATAEWRTKREAELTKADGWLTVAGLHFLKPGPNTIGTDGSSDIVLPEGTAPEHAGVVHFTPPATVALVPARGVSASGDGKPITGRFTFRSADAAARRPASRVTLGALALQVHRSGQRVAIRLRHPDSELLRQFGGLRWYDVDAAWNVRAKFVPYASPRKLATQNILGDATTTESPGEVEFTVNGTTVRLVAYRSGEGLSFVFSDGTSGKDTYRLRFLSAPAPAADGTVVIDFNRAYNPPCAFNPYTTCPIPPAQNRLKVPVTAGERAYVPRAVATDRAAR